MKKSSSTEKSWMTVDLWRNARKLFRAFLSYNEEYFKNVFLTIYNCVQKTFFANPVTYHVLLASICQVLIVSFLQNFHQ